LEKGGRNKMPIYEYECEHCGLKQERIESISEIKYILCKYCGNMAKKIISTPHFRVTGFNAKNGYSMPTYDEVIDKNGYAKKKWGKK
jgi:putative FmdB family regulatory protein